MDVATKDGVVPAFVGLVSQQEEMALNSSIRCNAASEDPFTSSIVYCREIIFIVWKFLLSSNHVSDCKVTELLILFYL